MSRVAVLSGGVGAARFLRGVIAAVDDPGEVSAVVNVGDDCTMHGLSISPDLDTITYTLASAIDPQRGWGLTGETWRAMEALERYAAVRPSGSEAGQRWFGLGDQDLATHLYRTTRLHEGATLTEVTDEVRRAWGVPIQLLPATDDRWSTALDSDEHGRLSFQDYFVRLRHAVRVRSIRQIGTAELAATARRALVEADVIIIAPSNPLISIGPIRALPGVDELLASRRQRVVAVSPIVGGEAIKGPAARLLTELGHEASAVGVAAIYAPIASSLVIDPTDEHLAPRIAALGVEPVAIPSVMSTPAIARQLAVASMAAAG